MTDTTELQSGAPAEDVADTNKRLLFFALGEMGIHRVTVEYDGSGDSGQIECIEVWNAANEKIPLPSTRKLQLASQNRPYTEMNIEAAIETLAYDYLETTHPGWEINDGAFGAFGTFVFDVPERTIELEHRTRFTDVDISTHQF